MRQPLPPQSKNGFGDLLPRRKYPKVYVLEAESSYRRHDSTGFLPLIVGMVPYFAGKASHGGPIFYGQLAERLEKEIVKEVKLNPLPEGVNLPK
jgi:hypothetical protein